MRQRSQVFECRDGKEVAVCRYDQGSVDTKVSVLAQQIRPCHKRYAADQINVVLICNIQYPACQWIIAKTQCQIVNYVVKRDAKLLRC